MARLDTVNVEATRFNGKIYSVVGKATTGASADKAIQVGYVGKVGEMIRPDVYEFLPLATTGDPLYVIATPEVNTKDDSILDRKIVSYVVAEGEVVDAVPVVVTDKIAISEDGVEGGASMAKTGYLYAKAGKDKLQYSATKSVADAIALFKIEDIYNATQGIVVGLGNTQMQLQYKMVKARRIA